MSGRSYRVGALPSGLNRIWFGTTALSLPANTPGSFIASATSSSTNIELSNSEGVSVTYDDVSVRELQGNHATQATTGFRPTYSRYPVGGKRNLLTFTEQFDNAAWSKIEVTVTANSGVAPNGTTTADRIVPSTVNTRHFVLQANPNVGTGSVITIYAKSDGYNKISLQEGLNYIQGSSIVDLRDGTMVNQAGQNGTTTTTSVGNGWWRITWMPVFAPISNNHFRVYILPDSATTGYYPWGTDWTPNGTSGVLLWGAQLELNTVATTYQRVVTPRDTTQEGASNVFYLSNDGNDSLNWAAAAGTYTIAYVNSAGTVTILTNQSLNGSTNMMIIPELVEYVAVNRSLNTSETSEIIRYLKNVSGYPAPGIPVLNASAGGFGADKSAALASNTGYSVAFVAETTSTGHAVYQGPANSTVGGNSVTRFSKWSNSALRVQIGNGVGTAGRFSEWTGSYSSAPVVQFDRPVGANLPLSSWNSYAEGVLQTLETGGTASTDSNGISFIIGTYRDFSGNPIYDANTKVLSAFQNINGAPLSEVDRNSLTAFMQGIRSGAIL